MAVLEDEVSNRISRYDGDPPLSQSEIEAEDDSVIADEEDIYRVGDKLLDLYDNLLEVETDQDTREDLKDSFVYNPGLKSLLKPEASINSAVLYGTSLGTGLLLSMADPAHTEIYAVASVALGQSYNYRMNRSLANASYDDKTETIGISTDKETLVDATDILAAELVHAYQDNFDSATWGENNLITSFDPRTPAIREGFERATRIKALETLASDNFMDQDWETLAHKRKTSTIINGYLQGIEDDIDMETLSDLGLSKESSETAMDNIDSAESRKYDLVASRILGNEIIHGERVFSELFNGNVEFEEFTRGTP